MSLNMGHPPPPALPETLATTKGGSSRAKPSTTLRERVERVCYSQGAIFAEGFLALLIFGFVLVFKWPQTREIRVVAAREELALTEKLASEASNSEPVDFATLSNQVAVAERYLLDRKEDIVPLFGELERMGKQAGLQAEVSPKPVSELFRRVPRVEVHGASVRLQLISKKMGTGTPPFQRVVNFLERLGQLTNKVEVTAVTASGNKSGVVSAQVELQFWARKPNEATAQQ